MEKTDVNGAAEFLKANDGYILYSHFLPDGDTVGSATALVLALRALGKRAYAYCSGEIPEKLNIIPHEGIYLKDEPEGLTPVSIDVASCKMLGNTRVSHFALSVDHHAINYISCDRLLIDDTKIATGEIVYSLIKALGVSITKDIASSLYAAICSDSCCFKYEHTTAQTLKIAAELIEAGADSVKISRELFDRKTKEQFAVERYAYDNLEFLCGGRFAIVAIDVNDSALIGVKGSDFDSVNTIPISVKGVEASAVLRENEGKIKITLRSAGVIDVAEIAKANGGGGHKFAAGFTYSGSLFDAERKIKEIFSKL